MVESATLVTISSYSHLCNPTSIISLILTKPIIWIYTIYSLIIAVYDGPSYLGSDNYIVHLSDFNTRALVSRLEELTLIYPTLSE